MSNTHEPNIMGAARRLIQVSASNWQIRSESAHAIARRAPHGYVPRRLLQRLHRTDNVMVFNITDHR